MISTALFEQLRVAPAHRVSLADWPTWPDDLPGLAEQDLRDASVAALEECRQEIAEAHARLIADNRYAVLLILQGMDASGKDGVIKQVLSGLNPLGCQAHSFRAPSEEELDHSFLWRYGKFLPERGRIGVFNRSWYEETLVVRARPELLARQRLPEGVRGEALWAERFEDINAFERHLQRNGTVVLKCFLHLSPEEQKKRLLERLARPEKQWKFDPADLDARAAWPAYQAAHDAMLSATSTPWAPWHVIPADDKPFARAAVAGLLRAALAGLPLRYPRPDAERQEQMQAAKRRLR